MDIHAQIDEQWKKNACKQVAKLTRTVFALHTDGMIHHDVLTETKLQYENAISDILSAISINTTNYQQDINKNLKLMEQIIEEKFKSQFQIAQSEFEEAQKTLTTSSDEKYDLYLHQFEKSQNLLMKLQEDYHKLKEKYEQGMKIIETSKQMMQQKSTESEQEIKEAISNAIQKANKDYEDLISQNNLKEEEIKERYNLEISNLKNQIQVSQTEMDEKYVKEIKEFRNFIVKLEQEREWIIKDIERLKNQMKEDEKQSEEAFKQIQQRKELILENYCSLIKKSQDDQVSLNQNQFNEIKAIKKQIEDDEIQQKETIAEREIELQEVKNKYQQKMMEYQNFSVQAKAASEKKNEILKAENKAKLETLEAKHASQIEQIKLKDQMILQEISKKFSDCEEKILHIYHRIDEKLQNFFTNDILSFSCLEPDASSVQHKYSGQLDQLKNKIKQNSEQSAQTINQLFNQASHLKNEIQKIKFAKEDELQFINDQNELEKFLLTKEHEFNIQLIDYMYNLKNSQLEVEWNFEAEEAKKQFLLDLKHVEEEGKLNLAQAIELVKEDQKKRSSSKGKDAQDKWDDELAEISLQIEEKTAQKKEILSKTELEIKEKQKKIEDFKKETKRIQESWEVERKQCISDYQEKFSKIQSQFDQEEKENENFRRMNHNDYIKFLEDMKIKQTDVEANQENLIAILHQQKKDELNRHESVMEALKAKLSEFSSKSSQRTNELKQIQDQINEYDNQKDKKLDETNKRMQNELLSLKKQLKDSCTKQSEELEKINTQLLIQQQKNEQNYLEKQIQIDQAKIDQEIKIANFKRELLLREKENDARRKTEMNILQSHLDYLQNENIDVKSKISLRIQNLREKHEEQLKSQRTEYETQLDQIETDRHKVINEKENNLLKEEKENNLKLFINVNALAINLYKKVLDDRSSFLEQTVSNKHYLEKELSRHNDNFQKVFSKSLCRIRSLRPSETKSARNCKKPVVIEPIHKKKSQLVH